jgi:predicted Zn-dependent protease
MDREPIREEGVMARRLWPVGFLLIGGCLPNNPVTGPLVGSDPFSNSPTPATLGLTRSSYSAPATEAAAKRVLLVGQKAILANKQLGLRPRFNTIGAPKEEVFHIGTTDVFVTEGLLNRCATEGQLAAVLCRELGKMVAERDALTPPESRDPEVEPPIEVQVGNDGGLNGPADGVRRMELAKFEEKHPRNHPPTMPVDPDVEARKFLERAGYQASDLEAAMPILQAAEANFIFEKQLARNKAMRSNPAALDSQSQGSVTLARPIPVGEAGAAVAPIADGKSGTNP